MSGVSAPHAMAEPNLEEAAILGSYLIGEQPSTEVSERYREIVIASQTPLTEQDRRMFTKIRRHPSLLGFYDAGLVILNPNSELRRRLFIMFSVLEATPEYHKLFLPQERSFWYVFTITYIGLKASLKTILGIILVKEASR